MNEELDFGEAFGHSGEQRVQLIGEAGLALDRLSGHLGPGGKPEATEEGDLVRTFARDVADVQRPQLSRLEVERLDPGRHRVPVEIAELMRRSSFYWLALPVSLWARPAWGFNELEAKAELCSDSGATTFDLLPDQEFATRFETGVEVVLGVDAGMKFSATLPTVAIGQAGVASLEAGAHADADAGVKGQFVIGPFGYRVTAPRVKHSPPGLDHAFWRLKGAPYVEERDPGLRLVLKVPQGVESLQVTATIKARRYFNMFSARLQEAVRSLPEGIANFIRGGTPIWDRDTFDLSEQL